MPMWFAVLNKLEELLKFYDSDWPRVVSDGTLTRAYKSCCSKQVVKNLLRGWMPCSEVALDRTRLSVH
jgi:hypothetical protein